MRDLQILPISLVTPMVVHTSIINDYCKQFLIVAFNSLPRSFEFIIRILKFVPIHFISLSYKFNASNFSFQIISEFILVMDEKYFPNLYFINKYCFVF